MFVSFHCPVICLNTKRPLSRIAEAHFLIATCFERISGDDIPAVPAEIAFHKKAATEARAAASSCVDEKGLSLDDSDVIPSTISHACAVEKLKCLVDLWGFCSSSHWASNESREDNLRSWQEKLAPGV